MDENPHMIPGRIKDEIFKQMSDRMKADIRKDILARMRSYFRVRVSLRREAIAKIAGTAGKHKVLVILEGYKRITTGTAIDSIAILDNQEEKGYDYLLRYATDEELIAEMKNRGLSC